MTSHKTAAGARGERILSREDDPRKIGLAVLTRQMSGSLDHIIGARAIVWRLAPGGGVSALTGETDVQPLLVDLGGSPLDSERAEDTLQTADVSESRNAVAADLPQPPVSWGCRPGHPPSPESRLRRSACR